MALTILDANEEKLIKCQDDGEAIQLLVKYLQGVYNDETETLISKEYESAVKVRFNILENTFFITLFLFTSNIIYD